MAASNPTARGTVAQLQPHLDNFLDVSVDQRPMVAGIIGDHPSRYAKSPPIWNAAFHDLGIDAVYVPLDVSAEKLPALLQALRVCPAYVGGNVTAPHKLAVMALLDQVDPLAQQIGAVNTICRTPDGRLVGYNTDAEGVIGALTRTVPGQEAPFLLDGVRGKRVLLIGAGGAGRAAAFGLAQHLGETGTLVIANRSVHRARELAGQVATLLRNVQAVTEEDIPRTLQEVELVVNATTRGQSGVCKLPGGRVTCLEPYSCLAPADPATFDAERHASEEEFYRAWYAASLEDIQANQRASARAILGCRAGTACFDLIYAPLETAFLAQARWSGHRTLNGRGMNLVQAVDAFVNRVMAPYLERHGQPRRMPGSGQALDSAYSQVMRSMARVW